MRRTYIIAAVGCLLCAAAASAQDMVGMPGVMYSDSIAAGSGGQLYPYDRQDPWLHGQYQRIPAYGGFASFRPYNYRHVLSQTQIATQVFGAAHGTPYSQQFWNRYRQPYLNGHLHSEPATHHTHDSLYAPAPAAGPTGTAEISYQTAGPQTTQPYPTRAPAAPQRPIHVFPNGTVSY